MAISSGYILVSLSGSICSGFIIKKSAIGVNIAELIPNPPIIIPFIRALLLGKYFQQLVITEILANPSPRPKMPIAIKTR